MTTFLLVVSLFNTAVETGQNIGFVVHVAKVVHHHSSRPVYRHVIRPVKQKIKSVLTDPAA